MPKPPGSSDRKVVAVNENGRRVGETHHNARVPDAVVNQIRDLHENQQISYKKLAEMFDLRPDYVARVCRYERRAQQPHSWKKLEGNQ